MQNEKPWIRHPESVNLSTPCPPRSYSTNRAAEILLTAPGTLRNALSLQGHYSNIVPHKGANGRWFWPADQVDAFVRCEVTK